jgi:hypothetical protein
MALMITWIPFPYDFVESIELTSLSTAGERVVFETTEDPDVGLEWQAFSEW